MPNPIYPLYTFSPDTQNLPVHRVPTIAWPVFVWDTAHEWLITNPLTLTIGADYYELTVDDEPSFASPNLFIRTRTIGAAPVLEPGNSDSTFKGLEDGKLFYWRVQAFRKNGRKLGLPDVNQVWEMRYDSSPSELLASGMISPTIPRNGYQSVGTPPVLGWLPVTASGQAAANYHVQISRNPEFTDIVDEAFPQFVNYVPWQGRMSDMPPATYWWRVRAESSVGSEITPWSDSLSFSLSHDLLMGNFYDLAGPSQAQYYLHTHPTI